MRVEIIAKFRRQNAEKKHARSRNMHGLITIANVTRTDDTVVAIATVSVSQLTSRIESKPRAHTAMSA